MWAKMHGKEPKVDVNVNRQGYYENIFGKPRGERNALLFAGVDEKAEAESDPLNFPSVRIDVEQRIDIEGERQWLGTRDDYGYGIRREKSDGLEVQIERELERRGYETSQFHHFQFSIQKLLTGLFHLDIPCRGHIKPLDEQPEGNQRARRSWWRNIYDRISQSGTEPDVQDLSVNHNNVRESILEERRLLSPDDELDDPPPPSRIRHERTAASRHDPHKQSRHGRRSENHESPSGRRHRSGSRHRAPASPPPPSLLPTDSTTFGRLFPVPPSTTSLHGNVTATSSDQHGYQIGMAGERSTFAAKIARSHLTHESHTSVPVEIVNHPQSREGNYTPAPPRRSSIQLYQDGRSRRDSITLPLGLQMPPPSHNSPVRKSRRQSAPIQPPHDPYISPSTAVPHFIYDSPPSSPPRTPHYSRP